MEIDARLQSDSADEARDHGALAEPIALLLPPDCVADPHDLDGQPESDAPPAIAPGAEARDEQAESAPPVATTAPAASDRGPVAFGPSDGAATADKPNDEPDASVAPSERAASQAA